MKNDMVGRQQHLEMINHLQKKKKKRSVQMTDYSSNITQNGQSSYKEFYVAHTMHDH
jgi:hypothetical protein